MRDDLNVLETDFLGAPWEQGETVADYNTQCTAFPLMRKREWGKGKAFHSIAELALCHWAKLGTTDRTQRVKVEDLLGLNWPLTSSLRQGLPSSVKVLKYMGAWGKTCKTGH